MDRRADYYAIRGRDGGVQLEGPTDPSVRAHVGADGGGHDHIVHDRRDEDGQPKAFLPRHATRGKDGAPADTVPALTSEMDRGDGHPMVYSIHPDAWSRSGDNATPTPDARGHVRLRDAGLGIMEDESYALTRLPPAVGPVGPRTFDASSTHGHEGVTTGRPNMSEPGESLGLTTRADRYAVFGHGLAPEDLELAMRLERDGYVPAVPYDPAPDGRRYAAMGDAVTVNVAHWLGLRLLAVLARESV